MGFFSNLASGVAKATGNTGMAAGGFLGAIAPFVPIAGGIASNILAGINARKARLYNSPANQVKRLREAGLPLAAGSNITGGQTQPTGSVSFGTENFNDNLGKGIIRNIDRKKLQIAQEELRSARAAADIATGEAKNKLNPKGIFENTNQGASLYSILGTQAEAYKGAQILNKYLPMEKNLNLAQGSQAMKQVEQNISNLALQNRIMVKDYEIKSILAKYQENMSKNELLNLVRRNTGLKYDNDIKKIAYSIEWQTELARITIARNAALASGESLDAARLSNILTRASMPSTQSYYEIRRGFDDATKTKPNLANTLLYLGMFQPNTSNYNFSQLMPNLPSGGNTYNTNHYINK